MTGGQELFHREVSCRGPWRHGLGPSSVLLVALPGLLVGASLLELRVVEALMTARFEALAWFAILAACFSVLFFLLVFVACATGWMSAGPYVPMSPSNKQEDRREADRRVREKAAQGRPLSKSIAGFWTGPKAWRLGLTMAVGVALVLGFAGARSTQVFAPLAYSKMVSFWLLMRFWRDHSEGCRTPLRTQYRFMGLGVCSRVLVTCWMLVCLGFTLALVSSEPVGAMSAGESLALLSSLYLLFRAFVRNPLAHPSLGPVHGPSHEEPLPR